MDETTQATVEAVVSATDEATTIYKNHLEELTYKINSLQNENARLQVDLANANLKIASQEAIIKAQTTTTLEDTPEAIDDYIDETDLASALMGND